jgi:predicted small integral membrane protein
VRDVVHVAQRQHVLPVATGRGDALFQQLAASGQVLLDTLAEQEAAAEDSLAVSAGQPRAVLQQLHGARFVLRHAVALVAAA